MFEQILRNEKPYLLPKRLNRSKNIQCQGNVLRSGLSHKQHRVNTLSLYCCEQKLNQTNSILPFHLEEFWTLGGERSELIVLNRNERSVLLQLPHPNSFGLSWRGGTLQGTKMASWVYFARSYLRTPSSKKNCINEIYKSTRNEAPSSFWNAPWMRRKV